MANLTKLRSGQILIQSADMKGLQRNVFKSVKVVFDGHLNQFDVYYKNWFFWQFDSCYKFDDTPKHPIHFCSQEQARARAIERARGMLHTTVVFEESNVFYY